MEDTLVEVRRPPWWQIVLIGRDPRRTLMRVAVLIILCVVTVEFVLLPIRVDGISMLPTYKNHRVNFINRLAYLFHPPRRGDVVAIRLAGPHVMYMKRIVGLPGEVVSFADGQLFIDGKAMAEPYLRLPCQWNIPPQRDGPDEYYVVGDNRSMPEMDHTKGRASRERILGKALW